MVELAGGDRCRIRTQASVAVEGWLDPTTVRTPTTMDDNDDADDED